jgi:hypothetical protein
MQVAVQEDWLRHRADQLGEQRLRRLDQRRKPGATPNWLRALQALASGLPSGTGGFQHRSPHWRITSAAMEVVCASSASRAWCPVSAALAARQLRVGIQQPHDATAVIQPERSISVASSWDAQLRTASLPSARTTGATCCTTGLRKRQTVSDQRCEVSDERWQTFSRDLRLEQPTVLRAKSSGTPTIFLLLRRSTRRQRRCRHLSSRATTRPEISTV